MATSRENKVTTSLFDYIQSIHISGVGKALESVQGLNFFIIINMITIKGTIREEPLDHDDWYDTWDGDIDTMRVGISRPPIRKPYPRDAPKSFDLTYDENEGWSNAQDMLVVMINRWLNSSHKVKDPFTNKLVPATLTGEEQVVAATVDFMLTKKGWSNDYVITLPEIDDLEEGMIR